MSKTNRYLMMAVLTILIVGGIMYLGRNNQPASTTPTLTTAPTQAVSASPTGEKTKQATTNPQESMTKNAITIQDFAFGPKTITIKVGESITWTNKDAVGHSATADDGSFDTNIIPQDKSASITFAKKGTYTYHCKPHPNMQATIVVE